MKRGFTWALVLGAIIVSASVAPAAPAPPAGLEAALSYPFLGGLTSASNADRVAWVSTTRGVRDVWTATAPDYRPRQITGTGQDDGQELTGLVLSPDGARIAWTRGGDHDANWPVEGGIQPNPGNDPDQPKLAIWIAHTSGGAPTKIADGDAPALSNSMLAYVADGQAWGADPDGKTKPAQLFFDRGKIDHLTWSPDGARLAFVSKRGDHDFVGVFTISDKSLIWLAPSTGHDEAPVWSSDGGRIAFTRRHGDGGAPEPLLSEVPAPFAIVVADATTGDGAVVWRSPKTPEGSYPDIADGADLFWAAADRLVFRAELDGWPHLYSIDASGGVPLLLTPGDFMVEHVALARDRSTLLYDANTGAAAGDDDRRHVFRVPVDRAAPVALSSGEGLEWTPASAGPNKVALISATTSRPAALHLVEATGEASHPIDPSAAPDSGHAAIVPRQVTFQSVDGLTIHGQLFAAVGGKPRKPALIFVHGGPPRQMLLGWSYMDYYAHAYAMNQYLASRGFVVLSINYRLGIGYGRAFQHPAHAGPAGGSEYLDVLAGAQFLRSQPSVDAERIGIWGGSYGGYLTALALARDSTIFKAGVDFHGVHDWSRLIGEENLPPKRYEQGDWDAALKVAFESSPVSAMAGWRSPILLIHGDDDRNVRFNQTIDLTRRLDAQGVRYEELVIPNEIHGFLRFQDWLRADTAAVHFLEQELRP